MKAHSIDLRERIIAACEAGEMTQQAVAERFGVSYRSVKELLQQWRETGDLSPRPRPGRHRLFDAQADKRLRHAVEQNPDATLAELRELCGVECTLPTIHNTLKRLGYRRKKNAARR
jgi:transposase